MDELDALRGMRTSLAEEESPDRLAGRLDWRTVTPPPLRRPRRSLRAPLAGLLATAAVATGSVAVVSLASNEDPPGRPAQLHAGNALLVAATNAEKAPNGRYWHTRRVDGMVYAVGRTRAEHYKVDSRQQSDSWIGPDGRAAFAHGDLPARPLTAEDRRRWQRAGSPGVVRAPDPDGLVTLFLNEPSHPLRPSPRPSGEWRLHGLTKDQVAALPTEPKALENALLKLRDRWHAYSSDPDEEPISALKGQARVRALSEVAATLLAEAPAPPAVRAAAFRMLAALPGVRAEGTTTDPLGRTGTVVSLPLETTVPLGLYTAPKQLGTYRRQWIINPADGTLLAVNDLVATPPRGSRERPPGDDGRPRRLTPENQPDRFHRPGELAAYRAYTFTRWTDTQPR
ncbi:MAG TPA: CU044_5270 family protein [Thermomonospora sp.]|nr:CU044_5270 family protein [Thermomonospora sp.]